MQQLQSEPGALLTTAVLAGVAAARMQLEAADTEYNSALDELEVRSAHAQSKSHPLCCVLL